MDRLAVERVLHNASLIEVVNVVLFPILFKVFHSNPILLPIHNYIPDIYVVSYFLV